MTIKFRISQEPMVAGVAPLSTPERVLKDLCPRGNFASCVEPPPKPKPMPREEDDPAPDQPFLRKFTAVDPTDKTACEVEQVVIPATVGAGGLPLEKVKQDKDTPHPGRYPEGFLDARGWEWVAPGFWLDPTKPRKETMRKVPCGYALDRNGTPIRRPDGTFLVMEQTVIDPAATPTPTWEAVEIELQRMAVAQRERIVAELREEHQAQRAKEAAERARLQAEREAQERAAAEATQAAERSRLMKLLGLAKR